MTAYNYELLVIVNASTLFTNDWKDVHSSFTRSSKGEKDWRPLLLFMFVTYYDRCCNQKDFFSFFSHTVDDSSNQNENHVMLRIENASYKHTVLSVQYQVSVETNVRIRSFIFSPSSPLAFIFSTPMTKNRKTWNNNN